VLIAGIGGNRHDDDPRCPAVNELLNSARNRRGRQFEEAGRQRATIGQFINESGGSMEFGDPGRIARAVADEEDPLSIVSMAFGRCHAG
jgi:hypothetical protein